MPGAPEARARLNALLNCSACKKGMNLQTAPGCTKVLPAETEKHMQTTGSPWAELWQGFTFCWGLLPGIVCSEEAAGSWKKSTKINSNSSQRSRFSYKTEIFSLLSPKRLWSCYKCLALIRKILLVSSLEKCSCSVSRWMGIAKGKFRFSVRERLWSERLISTGLVSVESIKLFWVLPAVCEITISRKCFY